MVSIELVREDNFKFFSHSTIQKVMQKPRYIEQDTNIDEGRDDKTSLSNSDVTDFVSNLHLSTGFSIIDDIPILQLCDFTKKWEGLFQERKSEDCIIQENVSNSTVILRPDGHIAATIDIPLSCNESDKVNLKQAFIEKLVKTCLCL